MATFELGGLRLERGDLLGRGGDGGVGRRLRVGRLVDHHLLAGHLGLHGRQRGLDLGILRREHVDLAGHRRRLVTHRLALFLGRRLLGARRPGCEQRGTDGGSHEGPRYGMSPNVASHVAPQLVSARHSAI